MASNCVLRSKTSANQQQKRWSQHIVASNYDDVCVLLKYQPRRHSQDDLTLLNTKKILYNIPPKTYSTLTHQHHQHYNDHQHPFKKSNNDINNNDLKSDSIMYIDKILMESKVKTNSSIINSSSTNGIQHSSTNKHDNNEQEIFQIQTVTDISGITKNNQNNINNKKQQHLRQSNNNNIIINTTNNGNQVIENNCCKQINDQQQQEGNKTMIKRRKKLLIRPISCFEPGDHV